MEETKENKPHKVFISKMMSIVLGVLGLVLVLALIGGGALLASRKWDPKWNPFRPKEVPQPSIFHKFK